MFWKQQGGYEECSDESDMTKSLRLLAVRWACRLGLKKCKDAALTKLIEHLNQPDKPYVYKSQSAFRFKFYIR